MNRIKNGAAGLVAALTLALTMAVTPSGASTPTPPTLTLGALYTVDAQNLKIWELPAGGGSPIQVADLSTLVASGGTCSSATTVYPWGAVAYGDYIYWVDDDCGGIWRTSLLTGESTTVVAPVLNGPSYWRYLIVDPSGNIWATSDKGTILKLSTTSLTPQFFTVSGGSVTGLSNIAQYGGNVYVSDSQHTLYRFSEAVTGSSISLETVATGLPDGRLKNGMTIDGNGNIFYSTYTGIDEIAAGTTTASPVAQTCATGGIEEMAYLNGRVYFTSYQPGVVCEFSSDLTSATALASNPDPTAYTGFNPEGLAMYGAGVPLATPTGITADSRLSGSGSAAKQTVTAQWTAVTGATSYTCTLMTGANSPTTTTVTTTSPTCSFSGLSVLQAYGISVVANGPGVPSSAASAFAAKPTLPPVKHVTHHDNFKVYFSMGSSKLTASDLASLKALKRVLGTATKVSITVTGWVQPTSGSKTPYAQLGLARAEATASALRALAVHGTYVVKNGGLASANTASSRYASVSVTW